MLRGINAAAAGGDVATRGDGAGEAPGVSDVIGQVFVIGGRSITVTDHLADGGFGTVYLVQDSTREIFVLKKMLAQAPEVVAQLQQEATLLQRLSHPNLVTCHGVELHRRGPEEVHIRALFEYCPGGHMLRRIQRLMEGDNHFSPARALSIFLPICEAVAYLHGQDPPIAHRDLKFENVLVSRDGTIRLTDLGSASMHRGPVESKRDRLEQEDAIERFTTPQFRSPEMVDLYSGEPLDERVDIWALGCLFYALLYFRQPFPDATPLAVLSGRYTIPAAPRYPPAFIHIIRACLVQQSSQRPTAHSIVQYCTALRDSGRVAALDCAPDELGLPPLRTAAERDIPFTPEEREGAAAVDSFDPFAKSRAVEAAQRRGQERLREARGGKSKSKSKSSKSKSKSQGDSACKGGDSPAAAGSVDAATSVQKSSALQRRLRERRQQQQQQQPLATSAPKPIPRPSAPVKGNARDDDWLQADAEEALQDGGWDDAVLEAAEGGDDFFSFPAREADYVEAAPRASADATQQDDDPFADGDDPFADGDDPFADGNDPFADGHDPFQARGEDNGRNASHDPFSTPSRPAPPGPAQTAPVDRSGPRSVTRRLSLGDDRDRTAGGTGGGGWPQQPPMVPFVPGAPVGVGPQAASHPAYCSAPGVIASDGRSHPAAGLPLEQLYAQAQRDPFADIGAPPGRGPAGPWR